MHYISAQMLRSAKVRRQLLINQFDIAVKWRLKASPFTTRSGRRSSPHQNKAPCLKRFDNNFHRTIQRSPLNCTSSSITLKAAFSNRTLIPSEVPIVAPRHNKTSNNMIIDPNMFATLVVELPSSKYWGGELEVSHKGVKKTYSPDDRSKAMWVAFFSSCEHSIKRVSFGYVQIISKLERSRGFQSSMHAHL